MIEPIMMLVAGVPTNVGQVQYETAPDGKKLVISVTFDLLGTDRHNREVIDQLSQEFASIYGFDRMEPS